MIGARSYLRRTDGTLLGARWTGNDRKVLVWVTPAGEEMLRSLTKAHREEHKRLAEILAILNDHPDID